MIPVEKKSCRMTIGRKDDHTHTHLVCNTMRWSKGCEWRTNDLTRISVTFVVSLLSCVCHNKISTWKRKTIASLLSRIIGLPAHDIIINSTAPNVLYPEAKRQNKPNTNRDKWIYSTWKQQVTCIFHFENKKKKKKTPHTRTSNVFLNWKDFTSNSSFWLF